MTDETGSLPEWMDAELRLKLAADFELNKRLFEPHLEAFEAAVKGAEMLRALSDSMFTQAAKMAAEFAQFQTRMAESMALEEEFLPKLAAHGWLISPLSPWDEPERLHDLYEQGGIDAVESDLLGSFDVDDFRVIVDDITKKGQPFSEWAPTFEKAIAAVERGHHELAIPIWLAALDGVCRSELEIEVYSQIPKKRRRKAVASKLTGGVARSRYEPMVVAWLEVLLGFSAQRADKTVALLNRHEVMHGKRPQIGTRKDAIQCLLALQVLAYLLNEREGKK